MPGIGFDVGNYNLICARRQKNGTEIKYIREVNAFIELELQDLIKGNLSLIERGDRGYIFGQAAINMASSKYELKRPMFNGCLNPGEKNAFKILQIMCHSMIGKNINERDVLYYCVPSNAINAEIDVKSHCDVLFDIFKSYKVGGKTLTLHHINEGMALIYAELGDKQFSGIGISFGTAMVNYCHAINATEVSSFSIVNTGDWIDGQKIDLLAEPIDIIERAIKMQYRLMVEDTVTHIKKAIQNSGIHSEQPIDVVVAGGIASPNGFVDMIREVIQAAKLPILIGEVRRPDDNLYAVSRGCLIAAEASQA